MLLPNRPALKNILSRCPTPYHSYAKESSSYNENNNEDTAFVKPICGSETENETKYPAKCSSIMDNDKELNDEQYRAQLAKVFLSYNRSVIDDILGKSTHYKSMCM